MGQIICKGYGTVVRTLMKLVFMCRVQSLECSCPRMVAIQGRWFPVVASTDLKGKSSILCNLGCPVSGSSFQGCSMTRIDPWIGLFRLQTKSLTETIISLVLNWELSDFPCCRHRMDFGASRKGTSWTELHTQQTVMQRYLIEHGGSPSCARDGTSSDSPPMPRRFYYLALNAIRGPVRLRLIHPRQPHSGSVSPVVSISHRFDCVAGTG